MKHLNIVLFLMIATPAFAETSAPPAKEQPQALLKPVWDGLDYFFIDPIKGIPTFFKESVDDFVEEVVKFGVLYIAYRLSPMADATTLIKVASFPVIYVLANLVGDVADKSIEKLQPGNANKPQRTVLADVIRKHDAIGKLINDAVEDGVKVACYGSKFAKGFAPSMIWAQILQSNNGPQWAISALKGYAYFAAATKLFTDTNQCTKTSDEYAKWAEDQWNRL